MRITPLSNPSIQPPMHSGTQGEIFCLLLYMSLRLLAHDFLQGHLGFTIYQKHILLYLKMLQKCACPVAPSVRATPALSCLQRKFRTPPLGSQCLP